MNADDFNPNNVAIPHLPQDRVTVVPGGGWRVYVDGQEDHIFFEKWKAEAYRLGLIEWLKIEEQRKEQR